MFDPGMLQKRGIELLKAADQFEKVLCTVFEDPFLEKIKAPYKEVLDSDYDSDKNSLGGDAAAIRLMRAIREELRKIGFAPNTPLKIDEHETVDSLLTRRTELLKNNEKFQKMFSKTWSYDVEIMDPNFGYDFDGWDYRGIDMRPEEWILKIGRRKPSHLYYNELDHYLTYLVSAIRRNRDAPDKSRECGLMVLKHEIDALPPRARAFK